MSFELTKFIQKAINRLGYKPKLVVDGIYGPKTSRAVKSFQQTRGINATGIVDYKTLMELSKITGLTPSPDIVKETFGVTRRLPPMIINKISWPLVLTFTGFGVIIIYILTMSTKKGK